MAKANKQCLLDLFQLPEDTKMEKKGMHGCKYILIILYVELPAFATEAS